MIKILIISLLLLMGCGTGRAYKYPYYPSDMKVPQELRNNCGEIAQQTYDRAIRWGYEAKIETGYFNGKPHAWVEYKNGDKFLVWDEAIDYVGKSRWTAEELGYKRKES